MPVRQARLLFLLLRSHVDDLIEDDDEDDLDGQEDLQFVSYKLYWQKSRVGEGGSKLEADSHVL